MDAYPSACFPYLLNFADPDQLNEDGCVIPIAKIAEQHNAGLKVMVANLNVELVGVKLILFSLHDVFMSAIRKPSKFGESITFRKSSFLTLEQWVGPCGNYSFRYYVN